MWCCASKPQVKKVLRSAKQQPLSKVLLSLPPTIQLQYKNQWIGKIISKQATQKQPFQNIKQNNNNNQQSSQNINQLKQKIQQLQRLKANILSQYQQQQKKQKQLQQSLSKTQAIQTVLNYMVLKKQREIDSFAMKIKT